MKAVNDLTGATLYGWVSRALSGEKGLRGWVWLLIYSLETDIQEKCKREGKNFSVEPTDVIITEAWKAKGKKYLNVEQYEYALTFGLGCDHRGRNSDYALDWNRIRQRARYSVRQL